MSLLYSTFTANNLAGFYTSSQQGVGDDLGASLFPARKQLGLTMDFVKGSNNRPAVLRASAFDTQVTIRDRMSVDLTSQKMPFFKESMLIKEEDRQRLNELSQTQNQDLIDVVTARVFDDQKTLIDGAKARLEAMRMQALATGKIAVQSNGVAYDFDYGVLADHKKDVKTPWTQATATPLDDLESAIDALETLGYKAEVMVLNAVTFNLLKNHASTITAVNPLTKVKVTKNALIDYLAESYDIKVVIKNETYVDDDGQTKKYFPDNRITLCPNTQLGNTVFGTTPEESDLQSGANIDVSTVENGITITTSKKADPVNVQTKVSMIAIPSFEGVDSCYFLNVGIPNA